MIICHNCYELFPEEGNRRDEDKLIGAYRCPWCGETDDISRAVTCRGCGEDTDPDTLVSGFCPKCKGETMHRYYQAMAAFTEAERELITEVKEGEYA